MLNTATKYDAIKYTALLTVGTFTEDELAMFAKVKTNYPFTSDDVRTVVENMVGANMIMLCDSIPCNVYIVNDPDMWEEEATKFFKNHAKEFANAETPIVSVGIKLDFPESATVAQTAMSPTPAEEKEAVKAERELSYAEKMNKNSYFNRVKEESKKKKKKK